MKVSIHHLPTGCSWLIETSEENKNAISFNIRNNEKLLLSDTEGVDYLFPKEILNQSVIKVIQ